MKNKFAVLMAMALSGSYPSLDPEPTMIRPEDIDVRERPKVRSSGLKYFPEYGVWAINKKNAIRKSKSK